VRFHIHAPIPPPRSWVASVDAESPPGFIRLIGATITARATRGTSAGTDLVLSDALRTQVQRLLEAFEQCDASSRLEIITIAERLASAT
jgi:hypothetical protein